MSFEIISHRCNGFGHPENSLVALDAALGSSVDMVEIDIRLTKDSRWVVMHNPFLTERRKTLRVHEHQYSVLKAEAALLDTMLARIARLKRGVTKTIMIDVKDVGGERSLVAMLRKHKLGKRVIVIAWEPEILRRVHALAPKLRIGLSYVPIHSTMTFLKGALDTPLSRHNVLPRFNCDCHFTNHLGKGVVHQHYLSYIPDLSLYSIQVPARLCTKKLIDIAHKRSIKVYPFIVDSNSLVSRLQVIGVDGIMTDKPAMILGINEAREVKKRDKRSDKKISAFSRLSSSWSS